MRLAVHYLIKPNADYTFGLNKNKLIAIGYWILHVNKEWLLPKEGKTE